MPRYSAYKDSGVDWLREIPEGWELVPLRGILNFRNEKNDPIITEDILSLSIANGVTQYSDEGRGGNKRKDDLTAYKIARPNDIVMNSMNIIVGAVGLSKYLGAISPVYYALYAQSSSVFISFYEQIFQHIGFQRGLLRLGKGILIKIGDSGKMNTIRMKISQNDMKSLLFPKPSIETQILITDFLNQKTAQIDQSIAIKQKQIELLKERQQIIIQQAVTKGLDPNVPMKDSGIEWIGMIPEHWKISKLKYLLDEINIRTATGSEELLSLSKYQGVIPKSSLAERAGYAESLVGYKIVKKGCLVINKMQAVNGLLAVSNFNGITSPDYSVYKEKNSNIININFLCHLLLCPEFLAEFKKRVTGVMDGFIRLYTDDLYSISIFFPEKEEQSTIVDYIEQKMKKYNNLIDIETQQIEKLKEYKTTLIDSAVTGKIKITPEE
ncbi:hypothetical protein A9G08_02645 [Gilliamella sp. wkB195]|nr:hypothetical protein A9G08_02645 [Gilliamella apicola]